MNAQQFAGAGRLQTSSSATSNPHYLDPSSATSIPPRTASAPLPSPTTQRPQFMSSFTTSSMASATSPAYSTSTSAVASASSVQNAPPQYQYTGTGQTVGNNGQQQSEQGYGQPNYTYQPVRGDAGSTAQETRTYIDNFALVAEAAKRAQMAVLMRDMEGVELTGS